MFIQHFFNILSEILPVFLIAVVCSSLIDLYLPDNYFEKIENNFIGTSKLKSFLGLFISAILGALIPICTCGMIPLAIGLLKKKLNWKYILAFLLAGNACSIPALILNWGVIGLNSTIWRFIFAVFFALINVILFGLFFNASAENIVHEKLKEVKLEEGHCCNHKQSKLQKILTDLKETSFQFIPWILLAAFIASLLHYKQNTVIESLGTFLFNDYFSPFFFSLISFPLYLCAGADVAMSKEFLEMGVALGSVLAFMTASPGVNFTTFVVYKQAFDFKVALLLTLFPIAIISLMGTIFNLFLAS